MEMAVSEVQSAHKFLCDAVSGMGEEGGAPAATLLMELISVGVELPGDAIQCLAQVAADVKGMRGGGAELRREIGGVVGGAAGDTDIITRMLLEFLAHAPQWVRTKHY